MCVMAGEKTYTCTDRIKQEALDDYLISVQISSTGKGEKPSNCATGGGESELDDQRVVKAGSHIINTIVAIARIAAL